MGPRTRRTAEDEKRGPVADNKIRKARLGNDTGGRGRGYTRARNIGSNIGQIEIQSRGEGGVEEAKEEGGIQT